MFCCIHSLTRKCPCTLQGNKYSLPSGHFFLKRTHTYPNTRNRCLQICLTHSLQNHITQRNSHTEPFIFRGVHQNEPGLCPAARPMNAGKCLNVSRWRLWGVDFSHEPYNHRSSGTDVLLHINEETTVSFIIAERQQTASDEATSNIVTNQSVACWRMPSVF